MNLSKIKMLSFQAEKFQAQAILLNNSTLIRLIRFLKPLFKSLNYLNHDNPKYSSMNDDIT